MDIDHATAYAFIGFALTAYTKCQGVTHKLVGIETTDAVAKGDRGKIDKVDEGVNLIECLPLEHAADECL